MEALVDHLGAVQFEIKARHHRIESGQPVENGGLDEGMTPPELLLGSLGSCAGFYAAQYVKKHKLASQGHWFASPRRRLKIPRGWRIFRSGSICPDPSATSTVREWSSRYSSVAFTTLFSIRRRSRLA